MELNGIVIDRTTRAEVIDQLIVKLRSYYIFPEIAEQICVHLEKSHQDGEYDDLIDGNLFALGLTIQLQEINHDEHLWVKWHADSIPMQENLRSNQQWRELERLKAKRQNYGIYKVKMLPGNVAYVDIHYLHRPAWAGEKMVKIMQFLAPTQAAILDLRKCTGGYPHMIALMCSYLFEEDPIHLFSIYWRDEEFTQQFWTLPYVPGQRLSSKPVYILTSRKTFSGGEVLAEILQSRKRAIIVGEKTDGGTHPGASYYLHPHFEAFVPIGRTIIRSIERDWEANGVTPDILLAAEESFKYSHQLALQEILPRLELDTQQNKQLIEEIRTALKGM
jgi:C-terminal processing protease CtpA/Prc